MFIPYSLFSIPRATCTPDNPLSIAMRQRASPTYSYNPCRSSKRCRKSYYSCSPFCGLWRRAIPRGFRRVRLTSDPTRQARIRGSNRPWRGLRVRPRTGWFARDPERRWTRPSVTEPRTRACSSKAIWGVESAPCANSPFARRAREPWPLCSPELERTYLILIRR